MDNAVIFTWLLTALGGVYMFTIAQRKGGTSTGEAVPPTRFPPALLFLHPLLASTGLAVWVVYVYSDEVAFAWIGLAVLVLAAVGGDLLFMRWFSDRRERGDDANETQTGEPILPEQDIPLPVVVFHGTMAMVTILLALLAALGIGATR